MTKRKVAKVFLHWIAYVSIKYHVKIRGAVNPYLSEFDKYFNKREYWRKKTALECKQKTLFLLKDKSKINR